MGLPWRVDILPPCPSMKLFTWTAARRDRGRNILHLPLPWPFCCVPVGHSSAEGAQGWVNSHSPSCWAEWEQRPFRAQGCSAPAPTEEPVDSTSPAGLCVPAPPARLPVSPEELGHHLQSCSAQLTRRGSSQVGLYHLGGLSQLQRFWDSGQPFSAKAPHYLLPVFDKIRVFPWQNFGERGLGKG